MNASAAPGRADEIERYLAGVSAALADLPVPVRQELLEDLPDHLAEIAADDPATLDSRLGPPPAYAAELRAAIGVDVTKHRQRAGVLAALRPHARTFDEKVGRLIGYDRLVDFLVQLRPAWWILRGYAVAIVALHLFADASNVFPYGSDAGLLGWVLTLFLVGVSVRIGRRPLHLTRRFRPVWLATGAAALILAVYGLTWIDGADYGPPVYSPGAVYENPTEVYVYDDGGRPLTDVRVYDRGGAPVPIGVPMNCDPARQPGQERRGCPPYADVTPIPEPTVDDSQTPGPSPSAS